MSDEVTLARELPVSAPQQLDHLLESAYGERTSMMPRACGH